METVNGYRLESEWKNSQCGKTAIASRGGKKYFLKKYQTPVAPIDNKTLDAKTFAHNKELFEKFVKLRKSINTQVRALTGAGGNIIIPCDEFIYENQYVEAAEFVNGVVPEEELEGVLKSLSVDVKKLLMQTAAGALWSVHMKHIVHSDLKLKNVLLVRNDAGNYVAKLIDFDSSYYVDEKPDEVVGTVDYYAPELGAYGDTEDEDERAEIGKHLTEKADIFSLGLIFHFYLSGEMPTPTDLTEKLKKRKAKGKIIYCWAALNYGCRLELSPAIKDEKYILLINDMLKKDPDERPTALEVLKRLREEGPSIEEPWPDHGILLDAAEMKSAGIVGFKKVETGGKKYELMYTGGKKETVSKEDLEDRGLVTSAAGFCDPWEDHAIVFDEERIRSRGFVSVARKRMSDIKGYKFIRADATSTFFKVEALIAMKYANRAAGGAGAAGTSAGTSAAGAGAAKGSSGADVSRTCAGAAVAEGFCEPWPEHAISFDEAAIRAKGFVSSRQDTLGGVKGYRFTRADGTEQFLRVEMILIQKMAVKK